MLLKVVIVEDNTATVRSLVQTIDWQALSCEVVGTAFDGESGRALILDKQPNIVLTDVRMPRKDGLEMIEEVRQSLPECRMLIITGYDQFFYASRAIKLGVFDYLLKPIDNDELVRSIRRASASLLQQKEADIALRQVSDYKRRAQLVALLTNDSQRGQGVREMLDEVQLHFRSYYIMVVQLLDEPAYSQASLNHLDAVLARHNVNAITVLLYDSAVVFAMHDDMSENWREEAEELFDVISSEMLSIVHIGVSMLQTSSHLIRQAYHQARQALWEIALRKHPRGLNFYCEVENHQMNERMTEMHRKIDELIEKSDLSDESAVEAASVLADQSGQQYSNLRAVVALYAMALQKKFGSAADESADAAISHIWFVSNEESTRECLLRLCSALRDARDRAKEGPRQSLLTRNALQYIRLHAIEGLRLDDVAEKFCVSANYLSALIRKETGITFHEHALNAKMEVARSMLADPRILVEEVARAVGYGTYISFYNAFKRVERMTPTEYRNRKVEL